MAKIIDLRTRKRWRRNGCYRPQVARALLEPGVGGTGFRAIGEIAGDVLRRLETR